ncbi:hypothetical protein AMECASPLE_003068 [Ameca splendens]|uniref:Secreted protein n=1 Tax=Ameca splendens TaxID=208324 RepID=A0ABV0XYA3_9TELE
MILHWLSASLLSACSGLQLLGGLVSPAPSQPPPKLLLICSTCAPAFIYSSLIDNQWQPCVSSYPAFLTCLPDLISFLPHGFPCSALPLSDTLLASVFLDIDLASAS